MAAYNVEKLPDLPIIVVQVLEDWDSGRDAPLAMDEVAAFLDESEEPLYYCSDLTQSPRWGLSDVISVANLAARGRNIVKHPNLKGVIAITTDKMIDLAARGMNSEIFGNVSVKVFPTLDELVEYVRSEG
jgi:hypothetical protein